MFKFGHREIRSKDSISTYTITLPDDVTVDIQKLLDSKFTMTGIKWVGANYGHSTKWYKFFLNKNEPHIEIEFKKHMKYSNWKLPDEVKKTGDYV